MMLCNGSTLLEKVIVTILIISICSNCVNCNRNGNPLGLSSSHSDEETRDILRAAILTQLSSLSSGKHNDGQYSSTYTKYRHNDINDFVRSSSGLVSSQKNLKSNGATTTNYNNLSPTDKQKLLKMFKVEF